MQPRIFHRLFIANRGEVAARVGRACDKLGITPVFGVSEADQDASYVAGRETVLLGRARATESYLDPVRLVQAAKQSGCSALHPGWGFLSENPRFAALVEQHGVRFVGPPAHVMNQMGQKTPAKRLARAAGLLVIDGSDGPMRDADEAEAVATRVGFPVLMKAETGGGGRGMRIARSAGEVRGAFEEARAEARAAFGDPRVYLEKLVEGGRHVEIQIMSDRYGNVVHLGERDCTVQRNHQKLIEESPAVTLDATERDRTFEAACTLARNVGYVGAGTIEFLLDAGGSLRFMEMNTRLQVEHTVSEMMTGLDLVEEQIRVAAGHPLRWSQEDIELTGHVIECRINAEDPSDGFRPSPGTLSKFSLPAASANVRIDTHVEQGYVVPPHYDSLICKVIAKGANRAEATQTMLTALSEMSIEGVNTTIPMHQAILASTDFQNLNYDTGAVPGWPATGN